MTIMSVVDISNYAYPNQISLGNISFGQNTDGSIFITKWSVPNVSEPTIDEIISLAPNYQNQFDFLKLRQALCKQTKATQIPVRQSKQFALYTFL